MLRFTLIALMMILAAGGAIVFLSDADDERGGTAPVPSLAPNVYEAVEAQLLAVLNDRGPAAAMAELQNQSASDPSILRDCHPLVHAIGFNAYSQLGSVSEAFQDGAEWCTSGYYHGVFEAAFSAAEDPIALTRSICETQTPHTFLDWQCHHGIGHGLMFFYENKLPKAIDACHTFADSFHQGACVNGAYMENFVADGVTHPAPYRSANDTLFPCNEQSPEDQPHCYQTSAHYFLTLYPNAYAEALERCDNAGSHQASCISGVGSRAMRDQFAEPGVVEAICEDAGAFEAHCIVGMTSVYLSHFGNSSTGEAFCATLSREHQSVCLQEVADFRLTYESAL